jgi:hypothetical protein
MTSRRKSGYVGEGLSLPASSPLEAETLEAAVAGLADLDAARLRLQWRNHLGGSAPAHLPRWLLLRVLVHRMQVVVLGDLDKAMRQLLRPSKDQALGLPRVPFETRRPATREGISLKPGALLVREWKGRRERVMVLDNGFAWNGETYSSLSQIAKAMTGTNWNGHRFFGLRSAKPSKAGKAPHISALDASASDADFASPIAGKRMTLQRPAPRCINQSVDSDVVERKNRLASCGAVA